MVASVAASPQPRSAHKSSSFDKLSNFAASPEEGGTPSPSSHVVVASFVGGGGMNTVRHAEIAQEGRSGVAGKAVLTTTPVRKLNGVTCDASVLKNNSDETFAPGTPST